MAVRRNCWSIPSDGSVASASIQPYSGAMLWFSASVSASWISMSGLRPGVTLRKTLSRLSSPNTTEVLLCSPLKRVECARVSRSWPPTRWNVSPPYSRVEPSGVAAKASR